LTPITGDDAFLNKCISQFHLLNKLLFRTKCHHFRNFFVWI
jgi:hypothetical protein